MADGKKRRYRDTSVSLAPLTFEQAIDMLAETAKRVDSLTALSDSTTAPDRTFDQAARRTARRPKPSAD
jgi:hypothetical protein